MRDWVYATGAGRDLPAAFDMAFANLDEVLSGSKLQLVNVSHNVVIVEDTKTIEPTILASAFGGKTRKVRDDKVLVTLTAVVESSEDPSRSESGEE